MPIASCSDSDELTGHVFISGVKDSTGTLVALAVDFVPDDRSADLNDVRINVNANTTFFVDDQAAFTHRCLALPSTGRLTLVADGKLDSSVRVRVEAVRVDDENAAGAPPATSTMTANAGTMGRGGSSSGAGGSSATGGSGGSLGVIDRCAGEPIDDAVWPNVGANVPPAPPGTGGTAGSSGSSGSDSGGAPAAGGADSGGAPGSGGTAGADAGGAPATGGAAGSPSGGSSGDAGSGGSSGAGNDAGGMSGSGGG